MADQNQARACYDQARAFYKRQAKSSNKVYRPPADMDKLMRRMSGVMLGISMRRIRGHGLSAIAAGRSLRSSLNTFGNCTEMSCVAISFALEHMQGEPVWICSLENPGDHTFVVVGDPVNIDGSTIEELQSTFNPNLPTYVLDVWCGIFCQVSDFYYDYIRKMKRWTDQHKFVMQPSPSGESEPVKPFGLYAHRNSRARIRVIDPYTATI
jgi:hypothetical protein